MERATFAVVKKGDNFLIVKAGKDWDFLKITDPKSLPIQAKLVKTGKPLVEMENDTQYELQQYLYDHISGEPRGESKWVSREELEKIAPKVSINLWILENY